MCITPTSGYSVDRKKAGKSDFIPLDFQFIPTLRGVPSLEMREYKQSKPQYRG